MNDKALSVFVVVIVAALSYWAGYVGLGRYFVSVDLSRSVASEASVVGVFENIDRNGNASGWARVESVSAFPEVHLWAYHPPGIPGGEFIGKTVANTPRDGRNFNFSYRLPSQYSGFPIYAYGVFENNGNVLSYSPKTVSFGGSADSGGNNRDGGAQSPTASPADATGDGGGIRLVRGEFPFGDYPQWFTVPHNKSSDLVIARGVTLRGNLLPWGGGARVQTAIARDLSVEIYTTLQEAYAFRSVNMGGGSSIETLYVWSNTNIDKASTARIGRIVRISRNNLSKAAVSAAGTRKENILNPK